MTTKGWVPSEETKRRISEALKGKKWTPEQRAKWIETRKRLGLPKPLSKESRHRISVAHKGRKFSLEHRENIKKSWEKRRLTPVSEETREKMRCSRMGRRPTPESIEKTRSKQIGQKRPKASISNLRVWSEISPGERHERTLPGRIAASKKRTTSIEKKVAAELDRLGILYKSQWPIEHYIADFLLITSWTIIECDGEYWHSSPEIKRKDTRRDRRLKTLGFDTVRLSEKEIKRDVRAAVRRALL